MSNRFEATEMLRKIGFQKPVYIVDVHDSSGLGSNLTAAEHRYLFDPDFKYCTSFTSPIADVKFRSHLKYEWQGRGFCQVVMRYIPDSYLGVCLHECAHYVASYNHPERDDPDEARAIATARGKTSDEWHDRQWLEAAVHLWWRACSAGYNVGFGSVVNLAQYGYERRDFAALLAEAQHRGREPIEDILRSRLVVAALPPRAVHREHRPAGSPAPWTAKRQRAWGAIIRGCYCRTENGVTTIDGRAVSESEFQEFLRRDRPAAA